jgi:membrane protein DedA with SNARE-associated domain
MAIESACIPLPSEIIMPFAGYLASTGRFTLFGAGLAGALGCGIGSAAAYAAGRFGGRPLIERYGRYLLIRPHEIDVAERWFARYGQWTTFVCRLLPVIRTFISFPAGMSRMPFVPFFLLSVIGSFPWCFALAWIGRSLGERWDTLGPYFHKMDGVILVALLGLAALLVVRARRYYRAERARRSVSSEQA